MKGHQKNWRMLCSWSKLSKRFQSLVNGKKFKYDIFNSLATATTSEPLIVYILGIFNFVLISKLVASLLKHFNKRVKYVVTE